MSKGILDLCDSFGQEAKNLLDGMITCQGQVPLVRLKEVGHIEGSCRRQGSSVDISASGTVGGVAWSEPTYHRSPYAFAHEFPSCAVLTPFHGCNRVGRTGLGVP